MIRRAVFLDRDGVLNKVIVRARKPYPPLSVSQLEILPGVLEALADLRDAGFILIVVTNQPDVARGALQKEDVESINAALRRKLPLDDVRVCYHDDQDACDCRKPLPGLLLDAARDWQIDLNMSFMVGDRWRDIEAGHRAGCKTILIDCAYHERLKSAPDYRAESLTQAAAQILSHRHSVTNKRP